ncbi:MAG: hypothetical protein JW908_16085 [Anaerolineales bacterium]|nr:hypothetical protein [Anaerolineales bacterium]
MRYIEFRDQIQNALLKNPSGMTWKELKQQLDLPYDQPCQTWVNRLESEIGLSRERGEQRALVWKIPSKA